MRSCEDYSRVFQNKCHRSAIVTRARRIGDMQRNALHKQLRLDQTASPSIAAKDGVQVASMARKKLLSKRRQSDAAVSSQL